MIADEFKIEEHEGIYWVVRDRQGLKFTVTVIRTVAGYTIYREDGEGMQTSCTFADDVDIRYVVEGGVDVLRISTCETPIVSYDLPAFDILECERERA